MNVLDETFFTVFIRYSIFRGFTDILPCHSQIVQYSSLLFDEYNKKSPLAQVGTTVALIASSVLNLSQGLLLLPAFDNLASGFGSILLLVVYGGASVVRVSFTSTWSEDNPGRNDGSDDSV